VSKTRLVIEEADETLFWLELLVALDLATRESIDGLLREGNEIVAILMSCQRTARQRAAAKS
jgi:hypothetical protein